MARAGFTAISSGKIKFGKDGLWYSDDEVIPNHAIRRLFSRTLIVTPEGRARLELGEDKADVIIEDTPWVVTRVDGDPSAGFRVTLNDETMEPLDPASLRIGADNVLYCRVKRGAHEARFLRPAYYELTRHTETDAGGEVVLRAGGGTVRIPGPRA
jgi:hypothetical protein